MPLSTVFQSYHSDSSHYSCLSWVSPVLVPKDTPTKNPEDLVQLKPRTSGLRVNTLPLSHAGPPQQMLDCFKLEEFADNNFEFYRNCRKFSGHVENTMEKGEIAPYKQFFIFPLFFRKTCNPDT